MCPATSRKEGTVIRKALMLAASLPIVVMTALPASATCTPGRVEVDPKAKKVIVEPPRCRPFE